MLPLDLILTVTFIATVHVILGLFLGDFIGKRRELREADPDLAADAPGPLYSLAHDELSAQLASLIAIRKRIDDFSSADLKQAVESFRSMLEKAILAVMKSRQALPAEESGISETKSMAASNAATDVAGLSSEDWFPTRQAETQHDRRTSQRFKYERLQLIAPVVGSELPTPADFFEVPFHDLSADGFSFYVKKPLECRELVAQLGAAPNIVTVLARVAHQRTVGRNGQAETLVGCEILRRMAAQRLDQSERILPRNAPVQLELALST
jgi:hypothetical protein